MTNQELEWSEVTRMIRHWLNTPENGYLGSSYGGEAVVGKSAARPCEKSIQSEVLAKLKEDIPYLAALNLVVSWSRNAAGKVVFTVSEGNKTESFTL